MSSKASARSPLTGITRYKVASSNIAEVGHDENSGTIEVKFVNGAVWQYPGKFDRHTFEALRDADSVGRFFRAEILRRCHTQEHIHVSQNEDADCEKLGMKRDANGEWRTS